jgi:hypothetical protein
VIAEGDDERTQPHQSRHQPPERDVLAERRARRSGAGEPTTPLRRLEDAEAAVHELERLLADRERELRRLEQREYAEQQLRVEAEETSSRLRRRHRAELDRLQRRVEESHAALRTAAAHSEQQRADVERQRADSEQRREQADRRRVESEQRCAEAERRHTAAVEQHEHAEQRCAALRARLTAVSDSATRLQTGIHALEATAAALRAEIERERDRAQLRIDELAQAYAASTARVRELEQAQEQMQMQMQMQARAQVAAATAAAANASAAAPVPAPAAPPAPRREEMADALAAAVQRLRARAATRELPPEEVEEGEDSVEEPVAGADLAAEQPPAAAEPPAPQAPPFLEIVPRVLGAPAQRVSWLAPAIRGIAERRDARLAAELVTELLPAQRLVVERALSYDLRIAELGQTWRVRIAVGQFEAGPLALGAPDASSTDFTLQGCAGDFAELAAGGAGRRLGGLRAHGRRRSLRALRRARREPLALWDLAAAGIDVWPGLLLLALAAAVDPAWTAGERFTLAFEIEQDPPTPPRAPPGDGEPETAEGGVDGVQIGSHSRRRARARANGAVQTNLYVHVRDGAPLAVSSAAQEPPQATMRLGERSFMCMFAGAPLPAGECVLVQGNHALLARLLAWGDRVQRGGGV